MLYDISNMAIRHGAYVTFFYSPDGREVHRIDFSNNQGMIEQFIARLIDAREFERAQVIHVDNVFYLFERR